MTKELNAYLKQGYRKRAILAEFADAAMEPAVRTPTAVTLVSVSIRTLSSREVYRNLSQPISMTALQLLAKGRAVRNRGNLGGILYRPGLRLPIVEANMDNRTR